MDTNTNLDTKMDIKMDTISVTKMNTKWIQNVPDTNVDTKLDTTFGTKMDTKRTQIEHTRLFPWGRQAPLDPPPPEPNSDESKYGSCAPYFT